MASKSEPESEADAFEALRNLIGFLRDSKPEVRAQTAQGILEQSATAAGQRALLTAVYKDTEAAAADDAAGAKSSSDRGDAHLRRAIPELCRLVGDLHPIAPRAISALINLSTSDAGLGQMIAEPKLIDRLMENLRQDDCPHKRVSLMLLSNLTRSFQGAMLFLACDAPRKDLQGLNLMRLVAWFLKHPARPSPPKSATSARAAALDVVLDEKEEEASLAKQMTEESEKADTDADPETSHANADAGDDWAFVAGILANVTRIKEGRLFVLDWDRGILRKLLPTLTTSLSVVRRRGIARMLRNACTEYEFHARLLAPVSEGGVDLLHHALFVPIGPPADESDPLADHEMDPMRPELYAADKVREPDILVRKKVVEMLVVLTHSRASRELMRARKVYPIVREMHSETNNFIEKTLRARSGLGDRADDEKDKDDDDESSAFDEVVFRLVDHIAAEEAPELRSKQAERRQRKEGERAKQLGNSDEAKITTMSERTVGRRRTKTRADTCVAPGSTRLGLRTKTNPWPLHRQILITIQTKKAWSSRQAWPTPRTARNQSQARSRVPMTLRMRQKQRRAILPSKLSLWKSVSKEPMT